MQNTESTIYFNFSYFALRLLGKGLYSNHWTAIAELVANGLDAQADSVKIYINLIDQENASIEFLIMVQEWITMIYLKICTYWER